MSKRAVILAGGKGTRLRPYTVVLPKPLMPIGEFPILEVIIRQLVKSGFTHITLAVNHQAEIIKAFFQDGERWGIRIDYSLETSPLGTMGPLRLIKDLPENFLVMNGDILTDLNFSNFYDSHVQSKHVFTISSMRRQHLIDYGVLDTSSAGVLTGFREKPSVDYEVSMGVYMLSAEALQLIPVNAPFGFDGLMLKLLELNREVNVRAFSGYWLDIGRPDDYAKAIDEFENTRARFLDD
ncbi:MULTISPECIES: sugar phosphate nucleotidyltransferase [unclassified Herbaspirillum]|jgi:NDP-sugar pyrophosphorylase family protein|uniref:sugar phosphate nucleotidyltransferase n=1 Tax=unclassified Herbaspirillum TaxID=2624150 RepID=UPI000E2FA335|nr:MULTISPECIES: sugar phosphate nucleotidyltransferase [unclassified Herbaspirillum]RFB67124.1 nucleotidyltransferase family protein [Herbaspirillum sp. 3R-3a1]TFI06164.1 nucleotidyltransferase family protein [Herbaspirillum sp. 3R11]TFI14223.1 nucleotidyltransferase family protein [Herbaspirillum sp. 3R-11]TFI28870.1 nucleotidyltransferase family protein [Herbaspirillum sp. 3C11]